VLYFKARNGSYHRVPVINNAALDRGTVGGMTIYYTPFDFTTDGLKTQGRIRSFPPVCCLNHTPGSTALIVNPLTLARDSA